ncbi:MAG TPA: fibronectin type III domain-containing protein, partial [Polyangia bacterium]
YASDGTSSRNLSAGIGGYFGAHRCNCPVTLSPVVQVTTAGQTDIGNSTIGVNFLLGANCLASPASCASLGQVTFTGTQSAVSPTFKSNLVFQAAAGSATVTCGSLSAGSTTLWALLAQDGVALQFALQMDLPIITATVGAPTTVTALGADKGLLVTWTPPADTSLVSGYQVLCLPHPPVASTIGYESCPFDTTASVGSTVLTPADVTEVCSGVLSATTTSNRLSGLVNGTTYTVAVIAIDPSGGVSALSPQATGMPQPTMGFYEKYKDDGGVATGCALAPSPHLGRSGWLWIALVTALLMVGAWRRHRWRKAGGIAMALFLASGASARAQDQAAKINDDWAANPSAQRTASPPDWGFELGVSLYRPAVDSEFSNGLHPYADTFGTSRHLMSEVEFDRYIGHRIGSWGAGLRIGYCKLTGTATYSDGVTPSGDDTSLRLIPFSLSALYRADGLPGLRVVPLIPYAKAGLDAMMWTATRSGDSASHTGLTLGWHLAAGMALGLNSLGLGSVKPGEIAGPGALFFEWDYSAINGLGMSGELHMGDSTWVAGLMFDL